jgi:hypothetical protein
MSSSPPRVSFVQVALALVAMCFVASSQAAQT